MLRTLTLLLLVCSFTYAKDKEKEPVKPSFTLEQQIKALKLQRKLLASMTRAAPFDMQVEIDRTNVVEFGKEVCGDDKKFTFNPDTITCDEVKSEEKSNTPPPAPPVPTNK